MTERYTVRNNGGGYAVIDNATKSIANIFKDWADAYEHALRLNMLYAAPGVIKQLRSRND